MQTLHVSYSTFCAIMDKLPCYYLPRDGNTWYEVFAASEDYFICSEARGADKTSYEDDCINSNETMMGKHATQVASADDALLLSIDNSKVPLFVPRTDDGLAKTSAYKPINNKVTIISPNWADRCTWYQSSTYVINETATDSGNHTLYSLAHGPVVDTYHGRITFEDFLKDADGHDYRVHVRVNGVEKTEQDPHFGSGGDFTVDYENHTITFLSVQASDAVVTSDYHWAEDSTCNLKPSAGKTLFIDKVELQLSDDLVLNDSAIFQAYGYVDAFAPQLVGTGEGQIPSGTKIPLGNPLVYKTINDFLNDSNKAYPSYPSIGASNWRGLMRPFYIFSWDYDVGATPLVSEAGMEIRVSLQHNAECGGSCGVVAFYCYEE